MQFKNSHFEDSVSIYRWITLYEKYLDECQMYSLRITGNSYAKKCILETTINSNMSLILLQQCTSTIMRQRNKGIF